MRPGRPPPYGPRRAPARVQLAPSRRRSAARTHPSTIGPPHAEGRGSVLSSRTTASTWASPHPARRRHASLGACPTASRAPISGDLDEAQSSGPAIPTATVACGQVIRRRRAGGGSLSVWRADRVPIPPRCRCSSMRSALLRVSAPSSGRPAPGPADRAGAQGRAPGPGRPGRMRRRSRRASPTPRLPSSTAAAVAGPGQALPHTLGRAGLPPAVTSRAQGAEGPEAGAKASATWAKRKKT
jgi:hypothetical protein